MHTRAQGTYWLSMASRGTIVSSKIVNRSNMQQNRYIFFQGNVKLHTSESLYDGYVAEGHQTPECSI